VAKRIKKSFRFLLNGFASKNIKSRTREDRTRAVGLRGPRHTIGTRKQTRRPDEYQSMNGHMTYFRPMILSRRCKRSPNVHIEIVMTVSYCRIPASKRHFLFRNIRSKSIVRVMIRWKMWWIRSTKFLHFLCTVSAAICSAIEKYRFCSFSKISIEITVNENYTFWSTFCACIVAFCALLDAKFACLNIGVADSVSCAL